MFCKYKDIFGKVNEGVHSIRLFNIAVVDVFFTIILGIIIHYIYPNSNLTYILLILFLLGIICHYLFCVKTTINKKIFNYL